MDSSVILEKANELVDKHSKFDKEWVKDRMSIMIYEWRWKTERIKNKERKFLRTHDELAAQILSMSRCLDYSNIQAKEFEASYWLLVSIHLLYGSKLSPETLRLYELFNVID